MKYLQLFEEHKAKKPLPSTPKELKKVRDQEKKKKLNPEQLISLKKREAEQKQKTKEEKNKLKPPPLEIYIDESLTAQGPQVQPDAHDLITQIRTLGYEPITVKGSKTQYAHPQAILIDTNNEELKAWRDKGGRGLHYSLETLSELKHIIELDQKRLKGQY